MKPTKSILTAVSAILASTTLAAMPAFADSLTVTVSDKTNSNAGNYPTVQVTFDDAANPGKITVNVQVIPGPTGYIGDLTGLFFNVPGGQNSISITSLDGVPITKGTTGNNNLNGSGYSFNSAITIGNSPGINGGDDFQSVSFLLDAPGLTLAQLTNTSVGVRLQSVGTPNSPRNDSSKTAGTSPSTVTASNPTPPAPEEPVAEVPPAPPAPPEEPVAEVPPAPPAPEVPGNEVVEEVPEPLTMAGLALGAGGLAAARRRKANKKA